MPDVGTVTGMHQPSGAHVRVDSALFKGYEVTLHYEPLLAKVMAWGETRQEAARRLLRALLTFRVEGIKCNIPLLREVLASPEFADGTYHTGSLAQLLESHGKSPHPHVAKGGIPQVVNGVSNGGRPEKSDPEVAAAIGVALALALQQAETSGPQPASSGFSPWRWHGRREQVSRGLGNRS